MHVLQEPVRGLVDGIAEIGQEAVVPGRLQVADLQIARDQGPLKVEPEHDMEVVLHLVGLGADVALAHPVHRAPEGIAIDPQIAEDLRHPTVQPARERLASA